ncbi:hypothetical protein Pen02_45730 [Plantactinospora endophytica]|uniref:Uncharacterized protein n=1 Tax=Plantactinospora endophytica TaxID=673535 RepID=A0ABQ4E4K6_9ACTN|nr:hypothetical protein Pen02_45730 [Plantactinospora endophytica]
MRYPDPVAHLVSRSSVSAPRRAEDGGRRAEDGGGASTGRAEDGGATAGRNNGWQGATLTAGREPAVGAAGGSRP